MVSKEELISFIENKCKKVFTDSQKAILINLINTGVKPKDHTKTVYRNFYGLHSKLKKTYTVAIGLEELGLIKLKKKEK